MTTEEKKGGTEGTNRLRGDMPFLDHLEELRGVLIWSAAVVVALAAGAWFVSSPVLERITRPAGKLVFLGPTEAFTLRIKVALVTGLFAGLPFVLYKVWSFIAPGLLANEKKLLVVVVGGSTLLFVIGSLFSFFVIVPIAFSFLLGFGTSYLTPMISAGNYFGFVIKLSLALGIVFQLPLVVSLLTWIGILQPRWLLGNWRYAIVVIALVSALFTPPDIASQVLMGLPVIGLYFLSAFLSVLIDKRRKKDAAERARNVEEDVPEEGERR